MKWFATVFYSPWRFVPGMSPALYHQIPAQGLQWQIFNKEWASWSVSYVLERRDWRFESVVTNVFLPVSVGAKQCDGLGMRSVRWFNGRSKAAWGDGFNHICLLITLPSAALVLHWDISGSQLPPSYKNNTPANAIFYKHSLWTVAISDSFTVFTDTDKERQRLSVYILNSFL